MVFMGSYGVGEDSFEHVAGSYRQRECYGIWLHKIYWRREMFTLYKGCTSGPMSLF